MNFPTIAVHENKGCQHVNHFLTCFIVESEATIAKETIVTQGFRFNRNLLSKARQTYHVNLIIRDNPDQIVAFQDVLVTDSQLNRLHT